MRTRQRWVVLLALAAGAILAAMVLARRRGRPDAPAQRRVAVAVFANRTGDPSLEPLGSMAADWVTRGLSQTGLVDVVDVATVHVQGRSPEGTPTEPYQLALRNGAGTVVAGSYYLATDTLVIRATVEDAVTGSVLQTVPPVHAPAAAAVQALDRLREHVTAAIAGVFDARYQPLTARVAPPRSFAAYRAFVDGQTAYWLGRPPPEVGALFAQAAAEDSAFLAPRVWLAFLGANGAGCRLTDSIAADLAGRRDALTPFDRLTLDISAARCRNDWEAGFRLALQQAELKPRSSYAVYTAGFFGITSGHWRAARELLAGIDPERDLGWMSDTAKAVYWRDYTAAEHFLGDYRAELRHAEGQIERYPDRIAPRMFAARALAGLRRGSDAVAQVDHAMRLPDDAAVRVIGGLTPGLMAYLAAAELRVHGDSVAARQAGERASEWFEADPARRLELGPYDRYYYARTLLLLGRIDEAVAVTSFGRAADTTDVLYLGLRGSLAAMQGREAEARAYEARLARIPVPALRAMVGTQRTRLALALGERERALALLEEATRIGVIRVLLGSDMHSDMLYDPVRGDPRFERINQVER
jgi:TolB-like protein